AQRRSFVVLLQNGLPVVRPGFGQHFYQPLRMAGGGNRILVQRRQQAFIFAAIAAQTGVQYRLGVALAQFFTDFHSSVYGGVRRFALNGQLIQANNQQRAEVLIFVTEGPGLQNFCQRIQALIMPATAQYQIAQKATVGAVDACFQWRQTLIQRLAIQYAGQRHGGGAAGAERAVQTFVPGRQWCAHKVDASRWLGWNSCGWPLITSATRMAFLPGSCTWVMRSTPSPQATSRPSAAARIMVPGSSAVGSSRASAINTRIRSSPSRV